MTFINPDQIESLDGFQNLDSDESYLDHEPVFEWTDEDYKEFEMEQTLAESERQALAGWWEMEGVRCWTFGKPRNPYL